MQGHIPAAAARDHLFPRFFVRENQAGVPIVGLLLSTTLVTLLLASKYAGGSSGVQIFEFVILLATATTLLPYAFCAMALLAVMLKRHQQFSRRDWYAPLAFSFGGFIFAMWTIYGSGAEVVMWGILLLLAGLPVYLWQLRERLVKG
jgi:APA family basic amino acid/polyamine antiporter